MYILKNTFGVLTLQVGIILFTSVFTTLAACILLVNALSLDTEEPTAWIIMFAFMFSMIIIWCIAFNGACQELKNLISAATRIWAVYLVLWHVLVIWSFIQQNKDICIGARCPNGLWLISNSFYELKYSANPTIELNNHKGLELTRGQLIEQMEAKNEVVSKFNDPWRTPKSRRNFIVSVILTIFYTIVLLYSWVIVFSYQKEIQRR